MFQYAKIPEGLRLKPREFDACLIAGLFSGMPDTLAVKDTVTKIKCAEIPLVVVKESVGNGVAVQLAADHWSEELQAHYTAYYRSLGTIIDLWCGAGYRLERTQALEYHRPETHIRLFVFQNPSRV